MYSKVLFLIYAGVLLVMSAIAFFTFLRDKALAKRGDMRIKEKTLLGFAAFGGAFGALLGSLAAHHKTKKFYFAFTLIVGNILQFGVLAFLAYLWLAK